jgi:ribonuclease VapC
MFVDASALCGILLSEPEAETFKLKLSQATYRLTSAIAVFETVSALARERQMEVSRAHGIVARFLETADIRLVEIGEKEQMAAIAALERFGKSRHPAKLNMGDCFAYACAVTHAAPLLFKGDDFSRTDIAIA